MSVPFSLVHSEKFLNQLNSEIRYGFKTWFLYVNQTYTKSVTWWNRVSHFVVNQISTITTERNMLVVRHRVTCTMKPRMTLKFWSFCCHLLSTGDRYVPAYPAYVVLGMASGVSYVCSMRWATFRPELLLFFLILWKHHHFISPVCFHTEFSVTARQRNSSWTVLYHS